MFHAAREYTTGASIVLTAMGLLVPVARACGVIPYAEHAMAE